MKKRNFSLHVFVLFALTSYLAGIMKNLAIVCCRISLECSFSWSFLDGYKIKFYVNAQNFTCWDITNVQLVGMSGLFLRVYDYLILTTTYTTIQWNYSIMCK